MKPRLPMGVGVFFLAAWALMTATAGQAANFPGATRFLPAPTTGQVYVDDPWNDRTRVRMYALDDLPSRFDHIVGEIFHDSPLPAAPIWYAIVDRFPKSDARWIAAWCSAQYAEPWDRIGCVSRQVHEHFAHRRFHGPRTFCMYHAQAFQTTLMELGIPGTWASKVDASGAHLNEGHVANAVMIRADDGRTYSYVIDSGWFPGRLFPLNDAALAYHDRDHDGRTDYRGLPDIGHPPAESYRAAP